MNLELYKIFYEVAESKNITKASKKLCISQPAVTKHLKNLEDYLGTPLFIRTTKGVVLNDAGEKIYLKVKSALRYLDEVETDISGFNEGKIGTIKVGVGTTLAKKYLIDYIKVYHVKYPNIKFDISTYPTKELIKSLRKGELDFVVSKSPSKIDLDLNYRKLGETKYLFVASKDNLDLKNKKIKASDLESYPIILQEENTNSRESAQEYFDNNNLKIVPSMEIGSSNLLIDFIKINFGVGYVTELYAQDDLEKGSIYEIDITPKPPKVDYGIITLKNNVYTFYINEFINMLK